MSVDLAAWLRAQLDADAALARNAAESAGTTDGTPDPEWAVHYDAVTASGGTVATGNEDSLDKAISAHIARWDPARVLAEIDAKRRILELHQPDPGWRSPRCVACLSDRRGYAELWEPDEWPCLTVRVLAAPYAGREGWQDGWAVA